MSYSKQFLKQLDLYPHKTIYARITSLDENDLVRESLEGVCTGGSINIDGSSAIRRSCSLTLNVNDPKNSINDAYWAFNNKFKLEIGVKNEIDVNYPSICWFKQGIYIVNQYSRSETPNSLTISISGQDKMCRLNGTVSGSLPHEVAFGVVDEIDDNGKVTTTYLPLNEIIRKAVKEYGQEREENIIVNDLDIVGYELMAYRGETPMYILLDKDNKSPLNLTFNPGQMVGSSTISSITPYYINSLLPQNPGLCTYKEENDSIVVKVETGQVAGYHAINLIPSDELILGANSPLTSLLDKIVKQLGEFEYFYDLDGRFIFQKKQNYIQDLFNPNNQGEAALISSKYVYTFDDNQLITNFSESPKVDNVKNDFVIWGSRKSVTGEDIPIHLRYAIDKKPEKFVDIEKNTIYAEDNDWREVIYQMAVEAWGNSANPKYAASLEERGYPYGQTGYEQYYSDLLGFWRQLYNPNPSEEEKEKYFLPGESHAGWNRLVVEDPSMLNFWFDFLECDPDFGIGKYSVPKIGQRVKAVNDNSIKTLHNFGTPEAKYVFENDPPIQGDDTMSLSNFLIPETYASLFSRSAQGVAATDKLNDLLFQHSYLATGVNITTIPIYYLEPNTRVKIKGNDYVLNRISYQLSYNGTMSLSCTQIPNSLR